MADIDKSLPNVARPEDEITEDIEIEEMVRKLYARKNGDKSVEIDKKVLKEMVERFR